MSRDFPGTNSNFLSISNPPGGLDITGTAMTIMAWINPDVVVANAQIAGKDIVSSNPRQYSLLISGGSKVRFFIIDSGGGVDFVDSPSAPATSAWHHWAAVKDATGASAMRIYLDGVLAASVTSNRSIADTAGNFRIGNRDTNDFAFDGKIQDVAVYNAALTVDEIASIAKGVSPQMVRRPNLVAHYPLWGNSSGDEADLTGGVATLTETGTVAVGASGPPIAPYIIQ